MGTFRYNKINAHITDSLNEQVAEVTIKTRVKKKGYEKIKQFLKWLPKIGRLILGCITELS